MGAAVLAVLWADAASAQRVKGLDTSSVASGTSGPSQALWNSAYSQGYEFAFVRSSRGGTTAAAGLFDDPAVFNNLTRATAAGMLAGTYHYTRPDLTGHTGADEAIHYMNYTGSYMKPGYLLPVVDVEALLGGAQNPAGLTAFISEMITTIEAQKGITPLVYMNTSYSNDQLQKSLAFTGSTPRTYQWLARPGSDGLTGNPPVPTGYPNPYGMWDPAYTTKTNSREPAVKPWVFWQQTLDTTPAGLFKIDIDYANGNMEFVKDFLVPALWTNAGSGDWSTVANWNSDNPTYNGTIQSGPAPRLPNNSNLDWVKLQNTGGGTVTISSGAQTVRKLYTQQPLNISGGSLSVSYTPGSGGQFDVPSEFKAAVTISGGASYSAHTTQIDGSGGVFNINGGTVSFSQMQLASHASNSGKIVIGGNATFTQPGGAGTSVIRSTGNLAQAGSISLSAGDRTLTVSNGSASVDLDIRAAVAGAGRLVKAGAGTLQLSNANTYSGGTTISGGVLQIAADNRLGAAPGSAQANNIVLDGGMLRTGAQINSVSLTNAGSGYTSFPTLTIGGGGANVHPASANVLAGVSSISVTNGGSNYVNQSPSSPPTAGTAGTFVDIVGGGGSGATAYATVSGGVVTSITISNPGTGYTSMPTIFISSTISSGSLPGNGATASVSGITLQSIVLSDGGFDYTSPTITLTGGGGSGATASATSSPSLTLNTNRGVSLTSAGGTLYQAAGTTFTIPGQISSTGDGALVKSGPGKLVVSGASSYTGTTVISDGKLAVAGASASLGLGDVTVQGISPGTTIVIQSGTANAIHNGAALSLAGGGVAGVADAGYAEIETGVYEVVAQLLLGGAPQMNGRTYGSSSSTAMVQSDEYFLGGGTITVGLLGDYNGDATVDGADYVVWRKSDGSGIGYDVWRQNLGNTAPASGRSLDGGGAVPEPASVVLTCGCIIFIGELRYRRGKHA